MSTFQVAVFRFEVDTVDFDGLEGVPFIEVALYSRDRYLGAWGAVSVPLSVQNGFLAYLFGDRFTGHIIYSMPDILHFLRLDNEDLSLFHYEPGTTNYSATFDFEGPISMYMAAFAFNSYPPQLEI